MLIEVSEEQLATIRMLANYVLEDVATKPSLWRRKWVRMVNRTLQYLNTIEPVEARPEEARPEEVRECLLIGRRYTESTLAFLNYELKERGGSEEMKRDIGALEDQIRLFDRTLAYLDSQHPQDTRQE